MKEKKRRGKSLGATGSVKEMLSHKQGKYEVIFNFGWVRGESPETVPQRVLIGLFWPKETDKGEKNTTIVDGDTLFNTPPRIRIDPRLSDFSDREREREREGACLPPYTGLVLSLLLSLQKPISKKQRPHHNKLTITSLCPFPLSLSTSTNSLRHLLICAILLLLYLKHLFWSPPQRRRE